MEPKEQVRIIKCIPETRQALEVYSSIELALHTYGPNQAKVSLWCHINMHSLVFKREL